MPGEPVIVPPVATINQADSPEEIARVTQNIQEIFDKVAPKIKTSPTPEKTAQAPTEPVQPATEPVQPATQPPVTTAEPTPEHKIPSFIEKALSQEPVKQEAAPVEEEWPEELPAFKSTEESKARYKNWREKYNALKKEADTLRSRPAVDEALTQKLAFLEGQNKEMNARLSQMGVEAHSEFQQKVIFPMQAAWKEAARIVHEAGGDPNDLAKALTLSGRAQYEALDNIFSDMPESAKIEANEAIRAYKRHDEVRRHALQNAPQTQEALKKADMQRQYQFLNQQKEEMRNLFDSAVAKLRDEAKVEVLQKSNDPDAKWWNDQADQVEDTGRKLFLENTDMSKVAFALALAPMVDVYRKLWLVSRANESKARNIIRERLGSEPNLSESGGNTRTSTPSTDEDLKKPFKDVFLREFHRQRAAGVK